MRDDRLGEHDRVLPAPGAVDHGEGLVPAPPHELADDVVGHVPAARGEVGVERGPLHGLGVHQRAVEVEQHRGPGPAEERADPEP